MHGLDEKINQTTLRKGNYFPTTSKLKPFASTIPPLPNHPSFLIDIIASVATDNFFQHFFLLLPLKKSLHFHQRPVSASVAAPSTKEMMGSNKEPADGYKAAQ